MENSIENCNRDKFANIKGSIMIQKRRDSNKSKSIYKLKINTTIKKILIFI